MTRMNINTYEAFLAFLKQQRLDRQELLAQSEEAIAQIESEIADLKSGLAPSIAELPQAYAHFAHVADAAKAYLVSVNGAWRRTSVIAKALLEGGFVSHSNSFRANIETALQRRADAKGSPDKELIKGPRGWRYQAFAKAS